MITVSNLQKSYKVGHKQFDVLKNVSFTVQKGTMVSIMGRSGSGKSTLLHILAGLEKGHGTYLFADQNVSEKTIAELSRFRRKHIGLVLQNYAMCDYKNIFENIALPLRYTKTGRNEVEATVRSLAGSLGLNDVLNSFPNMLSGGELQRVAIARALVQDPDVILADEPTGSLDEATEGEILNILKDLNEQGKTIIVVTHDLQVAHICHRHLVIKDGRIYDEPLSRR